MPHRQKKLAVCMPRTALSELNRTKERKPAASHCLCRAHERKDTSHSQLDARHALFPAHAKKKRCAAVRKRQPLLRRRSPRPFPFLSRLFESRPRAFFSLHLTTPFGTPAPTAFFPALCTSLILDSPAASRLPAISPVLLPLSASAFRRAGQVGLHSSKSPAHDVPR